MAETDTKVPTTEVAPEPSFTGDALRPRGWMYKRLGSDKFNVGWYASPKFQLGMVAFVCFLCPGMFNALSGLGGAGIKNPALADQMVSSADCDCSYDCIDHPLDASPSDSCA